MGTASRIAAAACAALMLAAGSATAAFPDRPVTLIVVFPAGGATDLVGRAIQPAFAEALGTDVIVKNAGGGGGTIGTAEVANANPDGYTVGLAPIGPTTTQPHLRELPYDTLKDLIPVCRIYDSPVLVMVKKDSPYETLQDLVAAAKEGKVSYATPAPGSIPHVVMVALEEATGAKMKHIPFPGSAAMSKALLEGTVQTFSDVGNLIPKYDLRGVAVFADERMPEFPDVPTVKEALGHDLRFSIWGGIFAPKGTPQDRVDVLSEACRKALEAKSAVDAMTRQQAPIAYLDTAEFTEFVRSEYEKNGKVLEQAGLKKK